MADAVTAAQKAIFNKVALILTKKKTCQATSFKYRTKKLSDEGEQASQLYVFQTDLII